MKFKILKILALSIICTSLVQASESESKADVKKISDELIAIDVLLLPDEKMIAESEALNSLMREQTPQGFELDSEHTPHITLVQSFIRKSNLPKVIKEVKNIKNQFNIYDINMKASGMYHIPSDQIGLSGIVIDPNEKLLNLQQAVINGIHPYSQVGGGQLAFVEDKSGAEFDPFLFKYVQTFVPKQTGDNFNPHVTVGVAPLKWLEELEKKPFKSFSFKAKEIAVYQLGNFGTASKRLD
ncbi:TPA: hypothetical protein NG565_002574 [Vibrio parahaemolyticus]|nr:hypothetical protein [Vibrio parahaemolyticus]